MDKNKVTKRDNNGLEDFKIFSETKTLEELELQKHNAEGMLYKALIEGDTKEMLTKYCNAWRLASNMYHARKWNSTRVPVPQESSDSCRKWNK